MLAQELATVYKPTNLGQKSGYNAMQASASAEHSYHQTKAHPEAGDK